ncbi:MAG: tetratricopeptide repeat protein, partial [Deltaproteobacteria bacterium]|nr:tetratricopeptide repeat protein [Deltaproteobacteria bacterium]
MSRFGKIAIAIGLVALSAQAGSTGRAEGPRRFVTQLDNVEGAVDRLMRAYANPLAIFRKYPNQKRLLDARVFYELGQFENAAIVLYDVVERPDFQGDLEYEAALLLLGESLLKIDNPRAAREILTKVVAGRDSQLAEEARLDLLEIALTHDSDDALRKALAEIGGSANSDRTRYGIGKAYLRLGEAQKAIAWLQNIAPHSDLYARSRFYLGAAYVALSQYDLALEVYRGLASLKGDEPLVAELRDQAWLAIGRILVQQGHFDTALTTYQNIGRYSRHYEIALYEMAWAYVNQEKFDKALQTVEVLLLTVSDEAVDIEAHVLRGQLNVVIGDYEEALASYQTIVDRYAPIRNELSKFVKNPGDVQRYFTWLLERRTGSAGLQSPLS